MTELDVQNSVPNNIYLNGICYRVGRQIAGGGEGQIYILPECPEKVLKLLNSRFATPAFRDHLQAIIRCKVPAEVDGCVLVSLPETLAYDENGRFVGYSMPRIRSRLMLYNLWIDPEGYFPHFSLEDRYAVAYNLAKALDHLHRHGLVMGDLNPANIVLNANGSVTLCDLGSCSVTDPLTGVRFENSVGMGDYLAPEVYRPAGTHFTPQSDSFSLAVLIFQIITLGCHPFNTARINYDETKYSSYGFSRNTEVMIGSPYFSTVENQKIPDYARPFLPGLEPLLPLFQRVFGYNAEILLSPHQTALRPTPREWQEALKALLPTKADT